MGRAAIVLLTALALASCADDGDDGAASPEATPTEADAEAEATTEATTEAEGSEAPVPDAPGVPQPAGGLGEAVVYTSDEGWELTITVAEVRCDVEIEGEGLDPADDRFCLLQMEAENTGDAPNTDEFLFGSTVLASDDQRYEVSTQASEQYLVENDLGPTVVGPGARATIPLVFSLPADADPQILLVQGNADDDPVAIEVSPRS